MRYTLPAFIILILVALSAMAQEQPDEKSTIALPDSVMRQVVSRIVRFHFGHSKTKRVVPVSAIDMRPEWFPSMPNVEFRFVSDNEILTYKTGAFLVENIARDGSAYTVNVGWGNHTCDGGGGNIWKFRLKDKRVQIWPTKLGWGSGCGGNAAPTIRGLKVGEVSPNELPGYKFFDRGKLRTIRLGVSGRDDIRRLFGNECESECSYDGEWSMRVEYFDEDSGFTETSSDKNGVEIKTEFKPKPEFVGKVILIQLSPKKRISFSKVKFLATFVTGLESVIGDDWDENGFAGAAHWSNDHYQDGYGLIYSVYDEETFNNLKPEKRSADKNKKGDLVYIEYTIADALRDLIYTGQVMSPK